MAIEQGRWELYGSNNRFQWTLLAAFYSKNMALQVFDLELKFDEWRWIRLEAPDGTEQDRALGSLS